MTNKTATRLGDMRPSPLPFDPADLMAMRVRPADFARMCDVSRTAVSKWIKHGKITLGPDGLLDPVVASRQMVERSDPMRLRARVFKAATATWSELRAQVLSLETMVSERDAALVTMQCQLHRNSDELAQRLNRFTEVLVARFDELSQAHAAGKAVEWLDSIEGQVFWDQEPSDLSADEMD